ncbi:MAG: hypothetical protein D6809_05025, partial [Gammaproteobacteria bacterium]
PARTPAGAAAPRGLRWLKEQPADGYTLQLLALSSRERAVAFLRRHGLADRGAVIPVRRGGRTLYAVLYGTYPSKAQALAAARRLQARAPLRRLHLRPWVRRVGAVRAAAARP